jgi:oligosaccharyltransferase complex subunit beta
MRVIFVSLILGLASMASCSGSNRVLVLLDNLSIKESHSIFFKNLQELGLDITFKVADDPSIILKKYGSFLFDHLVIFSPTVEEFGGALSVEGVTEFVDNGGNVLIAGNSNTGDILREIARCAFKFNNRRPITYTRVPTYPDRALNEALSPTRWQYQSQV